MGFVDCRFYATRVNTGTRCRFLALNKLQLPPGDVFNKLTQLQYLDLEDNPFDPPLAQASCMDHRSCKQLVQSLPQWRAKAIGEKNFRVLVRRFYEEHVPGSLDKAVYSEEDVGKFVEIRDGKVKTETSGAYHPVEWVGAKLVDGRKEILGVDPRLEGEVKLDGEVKVDSQILFSQAAFKNPNKVDAVTEMYNAFDQHTCWVYEGGACWLVIETNVCTCQTFFCLTCTKGRKRHHCRNLCWVF